MKNIFLKTFIFILSAIVIYYIIVFYTLTNGYRDYENFCSKYISELENYHHEHNTYPQNLKVFEKKPIDFRYTLDSCDYETYNNQYTFYILEGLGVRGYSSIDKQWWYD